MSTRKFHLIITVACGLGLASTLGAGEARRTTKDKLIVLENDLVRATIAPEQGAALLSLIAKPAEKPSLPKEIELLKGPSFLDVNLLPAWREQSLKDTPFQCESLGEVAVGREASVELTATLPPEVPMSEEQKSKELSGDPWGALIWNPKGIFQTQPMEALRLTKRYRLRADEAALFVDYELVNTGKQPVQICLGSRHIFRANTPKSTLCVPSREGALCFPLPLPPKQLQEILCLAGKPVAWIYDVPAGWAATLDEQGSSGVVAWHDPRHVSFIKVDTNTGTVEVGRTIVSLEPGAKFRTSGGVAPVQGMPRVHGVQSDVIGGFQVEPAASDGTPALEARYSFEQAASEKPTEKPQAQDELEKEATPSEPARYAGPLVRVRLNLLSARERNVRVAFRSKRQPRGEWADLRERAVHLASGRTTPIVLEFRPKQIGTHILRAEVREGENAIATFEHPLIAGRPSGIFTLEPPPKEGAVNDEYLYRHVNKPGFPIRGDWQPTMKVETHHVKLAHPLSMGPLHPLVVVPYWTAREVVELAQRVEMRPDTVAIGKCGYRKKFGQYYGQTLSRAPYDETDLLRKFLAQSHEVIVLINLFGDWFPADLIEEIARQVEEEGVGLVVYGGEGFAGPLDRFSKLAKQDKSQDAFTSARIASIGRGRVAFYDRNLPYTHVPLFSSEAEYDEFCRTILWAARGIPSVLARPGQKVTSVDRAEVKGSFPFTVTNNGKSSFEGKLRLTVRRDLVRDYPFYGAVPLIYRPYPSYEEVGTPSEVELKVGPGETVTVSPALPPLSANQYTLDCAVLDAKGAAVSWVRVPIQLTTKADIAELSITRPGSNESLLFTFQGKDPLLAAKPDEKLEIKCKLRDAQEADRLTLEGVDPWARVVVRETRPLSGEEQVGFSPSLHACLHRILVLKFTLSRGNEPLRERRILTFVHPRTERVPVFELRGYTDVRVNPRENAYDVRVGGEAPIVLAWFNKQKTEYGGWLSGCKIIAPGEEKNLPPQDLAKVLGEEKSGAGEPAGGADLKKGWYRIPCLNDPTWRESAMTGALKTYKEWSIYGPHRGFACDEWFYWKEQTGGDSWRRGFQPGRDTNICRCVHCLKRFSEYAKRIFEGDLKRLNESWGTRFARWEEVDPPVLDPNVKKAPPEQMWPHILDHRHFIDIQLPELLGEFKQRIQAVDPGCQTGISGMWKTGLWNGLDIYLLARHCQYNMLYRDTDIWESFGGGGGVTWTGYSAKYSPLKENASPWRMLFSGLTAIGYYGKEITPMYRADHTFHEGPKALFDAIRFIRERGIDRLLVGHRQLDPIALYYSPRDIYVAGLEEWSEDEKRFIENWKNAGRAHREFPLEVANTYRGLLEGRYLQPYWVAYAHLEEGQFGPRGKPKLLLLPYAQCLSDKQAAAIERFVREGGVVVADVQAGLRDGHGKRRAESPLDKVFGIQRKGPWKMRVRWEGEAKPTSTPTPGQASPPPPGKPIPVQFGKDFGEPFAMTFDAVEGMDILPTTARPLASYTLDGKARPAFLVNQYGRGKAIYLGFIPTGFRAVLPAGVEGEETQIKEAESKSREFFSRVFAKILEIAEISQPVTCDSELRIARFGDGSLSYLGLTISYRQTEEWSRVYTLSLPRQAHIYDVREGKYVGFSDRIVAKFDPLALKSNLLYAVLPYKVEAVEAQLSAAEIQRGQTLFLKARLSPNEARANRHVLAIRVLDPNGMERHEYAQSVETVKGEANARLDLALNDPSGVWKLIFADAATGVGKEISFKVN